MDHDAFLSEVQRRAHLGTKEEAERAAQATLETLGHRLAQAGDLACNVAEQLPASLAEPLVRGAREPYKRLGLGEFFDEVGRRQGAGGTAEAPEAHACEAHACAVIAVLCDALPEGSTVKIRHALPPEFAPLFSAATGADMQA